MRALGPLAIAGATLAIWGCHAIVGIEEDGAGGDGAAPNGGAVVSNGNVETTGVTSTDAPSTGASPASATSGSTGTGSPYADAVLASGPVLYYRFEEASGPVLDEVGDRDGIVYSYVFGASLAGDVAVTRGVPSPLPALGNAIHFEGSPDTMNGGYVRCTASEAVAFDGMATFSVELWVSASNQDVVPVAHIKYTGNQSLVVDGYGIGIFRDQGDFVSGFRSWGSLAADDSSTVDIEGVDASSFHHYVFTFDGTSTALYLDGVKGPCSPDCQPNSALSATIDSLFIVGGRYSGIDGETINDGFLNGYVDEVAVYDRALTPAEVAGHFAAANP